MTSFLPPASAAHRLLHTPNPRQALCVAEPTLAYHLYPRHTPLVRARSWSREFYKLWETYIWHLAITEVPSRVVLTFPNSLSGWGDNWLSKEFANRSWIPKIPIRKRNRYGGVHVILALETAGSLRLIRQPTYLVRSNQEQSTCYSCRELSAHVEAHNHL